MNRFPRDRAQTGAATDRPEPPLAGSRRADAAARTALDASMRFLELVEGWGRPVEMVQALSQVGQALIGLQALDAAEAYFVKALGHAVRLGVVDARVDLLCTLAELACARAERAGDDAASTTGRQLRDRARDHAFEAAGLASQVTDARWEVHVLLRIGDVLDSCGDHDDAATMQHRATALLGVDAGGKPLEPRDWRALTAPGGLM
jgi:hypothetical protein